MTNSLLESIVKRRLGQVSRRSLMPIMITANLGSGIKSKGRPSENTGSSFFAKKTLSFMKGDDIYDDQETNQ